MSIITLVTALLAGLAAVSGASADTLILRDGTRLQGKVIAFTADTLTFRNDDGFAKNYHTDLVATLSFVPVDRRHSAGSRRPEVAGPRGPRQQAGLAVPAGTELVVRTVEMADSGAVTIGQTFAAIVEQRVTDAAGVVIVPVGASAQLVIRELTEGGAMGSPDMAIDVQSVTVDGRRYAISTTDLTVGSDTGLGGNGRTVAAVGGGAVLGTLIGATLGGGRGAVVGGLIGAAGGAGAQVLTRGRHVRVPADTELRFRLDQATTLLSAP